MAGTLAGIAAAATAWAFSAFDGVQLPFLSATSPSITTQLGPLLSQNASLCLPASECFTKATTRWQSWKQPTFQAIVKPATEGDIEQTIRYANEHDLPFLAISGGHGGNVNLAKHENGIGIWMRSFTSVEINSDGRSATVGGGILSGELTKVLWAEGKQSVFGGCECTGAVAPMLGGGHGWLQGRYGLMADNLLSARLTLGNGTSITISGDSHPELFWAVRGAGHNYGIVSSFEYKFYDRRPETDSWAYEISIFTEEQLEKVFEIANGMIGGPVELIHFALILNNPEIDAEKPIIMFFVIYQGDFIPAEYTDPLHALGPLSSTPGVSDLPGFAAVMGFDMESQWCRPGGPKVIRSPVALERHDVGAVRQIYETMAALPPSLAGSAYILEGYSSHGVHSIADESTAYPDRTNHLLLSPFLLFSPDDLEAEKLAERYAKELQAIPVNASGKPMNAYVNYANGMESQEALYGYEGWRLEKLRKLKREWDPQGRFGFYLPIES